MAGRLRQLLEAPLLAALLLGLACAALVIGVRAAGGLQFLELYAWDLLVQLRSSGVARDPRVVLVAADEADLERLDWPLADGVLAELLAAILAREPRAVALDLYRGRPRPPGSERLDAVLAGSRKVYAVAKFGASPGASVAAPPALAQRPAQVGFADVVEDYDGVVRKGLLFLDDGKTVLQSLALRAALGYLAADGVRPAADAANPEHLRLGRATLRPLEPDDGPYASADAAGYQFLLDFAGGRQPFATFTFGQVLGGRVPPEAFRERIVLVGVAARSVKDFFASPFREGRGAVEPMHGVALHAHAASQLVRMARGETVPMRLPGRWPEAAWIAAWCVAGALLALLRDRAAALAALAAGGALAGAGAAALAFQHSLWLPVASTVAAWLFSAAVVTAWLRAHESRQRGVLMQIFSRYVSRPLADDIWRNRAELLEHGRFRPRRVEATVLFSDIKGFTELSEKLDPQALMDWLSEYLGAMAEVVQAHGGVVDKFIGDAVMAVFGLRAGRSADHPVAAVDCALAMRAALERLNAGWRSRGLPPIGFRVGIHTGELAYGTVGSGQRVESTVIGDSVNIASRLESLKQEDGAMKLDPVDPEDPGSAYRILVSADTRARLGSRYRVWEVGGVELKGKTEPLQVYGVRGLA